MIWTNRRKAGRQRICETCRAVIAKGDIYLAHVASPDHEDLGNKTWWGIAECAECATRYGRKDLLEPAESLPSVSDPV